MDLGLEGKVALVTGGGSGIGAATVQLLVGEGARVAFADRQPGQHRCGDALHFISTELTREEDCHRCVDETLKNFRSLDILINNAGGNDSIGLEQSPAEFMASLQRNLFHVFAVTHFAAEALKRSRGSIVNVSSKVAVTGQGHTSGYAAAKGGVNALTREWAATLAPHGVRVNAVVPAECDTPGYQRWFESQPDPKAARESIEKLVPLGARMTAPEEIAFAIAFLASPRSAHMTGQFIFIDGGYTHLDRALTQSRHQWRAGANS